MNTRVVWNQTFLLACIFSWHTVQANIDACSSAALGRDISSTMATLSPARPSMCQATSASCGDADAIVFVHGIYGSDSTFVNPGTKFDWPKQFPQYIDNHAIDVYLLDYQTALLSWAHSKNPDFLAVSCAIADAMKPLRTRQYRTIGFIAHSLGGNLVSTYIHMIKTALGHPQRSQNAFVITLATPVLGAEIANIADELKSALQIDDDLLKSLKKGNLYLKMLEQFREEEVQKEWRYGCRPVHLHAAYEEKNLGPLLVVGKDSAALSVSKLISSPVIGFPLNHFQMAKPTGPQDPLYVWVNGLVAQEYQRVTIWGDTHQLFPPSKQLCGKMDFVPE
jgi:Putative serine esterase (DUF676)